MPPSRGTVPRVSVVVPVFNDRVYLSEAVRSVLGQTLGDLEVCVVDDGSSDGSTATLSELTDPRLAVLSRPHRGLPAARNAGVRATTGELVAFLDSDDVFEADKLARQIEFLDRHPDVGLAYGSHVFVARERRPLSLVRAPARVGAPEILADYPFAPSDVVVRRSSGDKVGWFDESFVRSSEDLDFHLRLALAGCRFAGVAGARTLRRVHPNRTFPDSAERVADCIRAIDRAIADPRCGDDVRALRDGAVARRYAIGGYFAAAQGEEWLARDWFREALRLRSEWAGGERAQLLDHIVSLSIMDGADHEPRLRAALACLPACGDAQADHAVGRGYLLRGVRALLWKEAESAQGNLEHGVELCGGLEPHFLLLVVHVLLEFESEFGAESGADARRRVVARLARIARSSDMRLLRSRLSANLAFRSYREGRYPDVPRAVAAAVLQRPAYLTDRGLMSVLVRSLGKRALPFSSSRRRE